MLRSTTSFIGSRYSIIALLTLVAAIIVLVGWNYHQYIVRELYDSVAKLQDEKSDLTTKNQKLKTEGEQVKNQQLQFDKESQHELLSVGASVEKLRRYIRKVDIEGTCYTTFAYDFDFVILSVWDEQKRKNWQNLVRDYSVVKNKAEFLRIKSKEFIWNNDRRLNKFVSHFSEMKQNANLVIFSIWTPKELIQSLLHHFPAFKKLEILVELEAPEPENRVRDILLTLIPTRNLEWYEIMFISSSELKYPCCKQYAFDVRSEQESLTKIEDMVKKEC